MILFYLIVLIVSSVAFFADLILRYVEKIKSFDVDKKFFSIKSDTVPIEKFFPENLTMLIFSIIVSSATASLADLAGISWYLSLPCGIAGGLVVCFAVQYIFRAVFDAVSGNLLPRGEKAAGLNGTCVETIDEHEEWGKVCFSYKNREFTVNAGSVTGSAVQKGEKVTAVYEQDGFYFVIIPEEVYKGIDTDF